MRRLVFCFDGSWNKLDTKSHPTNVVLVAESVLPITPNGTQQIVYYDEGVGTASISWVDSGGAVHLRVYATDGYTVNERCFDDGAWTTGIFSQAGGTVSATSWTDSGGLHIRVYCTNEDATVEWCLDQGGNWYQGAYTTL